MVQFDGNVNLYTSHIWEFFESPHRFRVFTFKIRNLENVGQGRDVQRSQWRRR